MTALLRVAVLGIPLLVCATNGRPSGRDDVRFLVIRRAGRPEKNYYELAKQVELLDGEVVTKAPAGVRYGVHSIWKVRVKWVTNSRNDSASIRNAHYVLIYERDPDIRFCAVNYHVSDLPAGARRIDYTDCEDRRQYSFEMTRQWPRPFVIYEVEILDRNVLRDLWERQKQKNNSGH